MMTNDTADTLINVVIAHRADGRTHCLADTEGVRVILDYPDEEDRVPEIVEAAFEPTLVSGIVQEAEEE